MGYGNDLVTQFPEVARDWHPTRNTGLQPEQTAPKSNRKVWWLGSCGHEWQAVVANRTARRSGCPYCANQKVGYGNDLATRHPELAAQWHPTRNSGANAGRSTACRAHRYDGPLRSYSCTGVPSAELAPATSRHLPESPGICPAAAAAGLADRGLASRARMAMRSEVRKALRAGEVRTSMGCDHFPTGGARA